MYLVNLVVIHATFPIDAGPFEKTSSENLFASGLNYTQSGDVVIEMNGDHGLARHASWRSKASDSGSSSGSGSGSGRTRGGRRLRRGTKDSAAGASTAPLPPGNRLLFKTRYFNSDLHLITRQTIT